MINFNVDEQGYLERIAVAVEKMGEEKEITFRNFTYTSAGDNEEIFARIPTYTNNGFETINATRLSAEVWNLALSLDEPDHIACKLPVIDGKCEFTFMCLSIVTLEDGSHIEEASSGCTLTELGSYDETEYIIYKVSIDEDNAKLILHFEV